MKKRLLEIITLLMITGASAYGQSVSGKVTSAVDGSTLPGVSILLKGSTTGTFTDADGKYVLKVPAENASAVLVVSFIGFVTQEVNVNGLTTLDISLPEDMKTLSEVVVTALGVSRESKTLVYATQSIKPSTLTEVRDPNNVINSLQGKVVGAQINQGSGGPGSGVRITLRGNKSIQQSNNALIVVDGVPINNTTNASATSDFGSVQSSDGASNINPDDIESMTILRGPSAAALYGSQAGNGVIVITTKKGSKENLTVTVNSGIQSDTPFQLPSVQNIYGQGYDGAINTTTGTSWGAPMTGQTYTTTAGTPGIYSPQKNNIRGFFRDGISLNNSIAVSGGSAKMQTYLSYTNNMTQGIIPYNDLTRHTINLRITNQISEKFSTDAKVTYINQDISGRPRTGEENAPVIDIYQIPRSTSLAQAKNYQTISPLGVPQPTVWPSTLSSIYQNPYWMLHNTGISENRDRIMGFLSGKYKIAKWLTATGRANLDKYVDQGQQQYADGTLLWINSQGGGGFYGKTLNTSIQQWYDFILQGDHSIGKDFKLNYTAGAIWQDIVYNTETNTTQGLSIPDKFSLNYAVNPTFASTSTGTRTESVFGQFSLAYKEALFVEGSARNEWDSRLGPPYTITYPSIGVSGIISDLVTLPTAFSFLKLNLNYAKVGNGGLPQLRNPTWNYSQGAGSGNISRSYTQPFANLKPEIVTGIEAGIDARFVENRVGFTANIYKSNSKDQLLQLPISNASGFQNKYINAGNIQNKGIEIVVNGTPIKNGKLTWDVALNFALNRNKIIALDPNIKSTYLGGSSGDGRTATPIIREGGSYGDLVSWKWATDAQGRHIVDAKGLPVASATQEYIGTFNPKALLGLTNTFTYGRFSARVLVDGRIGGTIVDGTEMNLAFSGISKITAKNRTEAWTLGGVDANGNANTKTITSEQFWNQGGSASVTGQRYGVGEFFAYNATNFRVRELSVGYGIPIPATFFIKSARISFVARNLFWVYRGSSLLDIPGLGKRKMQIDPDMSLGNGNYQGIQLASMPSTRSIGLNLKLTF